LPDVWIVPGENLCEVTLAFHAQRRELGDVDLAGPFVLVLDQQPRPLVALPPRRLSSAPALGPDQHPRALQLVAVQRKFQIAFLQGRVDIVDLRRPRAAVPQHDDPGPVTGWDHAFELPVLDRVILDVHGQPFCCRVERRPLGHRPREQHAVVLETEVVMKMTGEVFLDAKESRRAPSRGPGAARRQLRVTGGFR
jgi:hypothetical protein